MSIHGHILEDSLATKDGVVVGRSTYEVAGDGNTMTATVSGTDAAGRPFDQVIVFDRQSARETTADA